MDYDTCIDAINECDWKAFDNKLDIIVEFSNDNTLTKEGDTLILRTNENLAQRFGIFKEYINKFHIKSAPKYNRCSYDDGSCHLEKMWTEGNQQLIPNLVLSYVFEYTLDDEEEVYFTRISTGISIKTEYNPCVCVKFEVYENLKLIGKFSLWEHQSVPSLTSYFNDKCLNTSFDEEMEGYLPDEEVELALFNLASAVLEKWIA